VEEEVSIIARVNRKKKIRLFQILMGEGSDFSKWLRQQIDRRLERERKKRGRRRKNGKEAKRKPRS
jgi:hypothetical protein